MNNPTQYGDNATHIQGGTIQNVMGGSGNTFNNYEAQPHAPPPSPSTT
ncbi:MAG: hypothetical protein IPL28_02910 [Chloroflexi bacterium]|nr:hypothetical protein [Chloroflexota bacterium]